MFGAPPEVPLCGGLPFTIMENANEVLMRLFSRKAAAVPEGKLVKSPNLCDSRPPRVTRFVLGDAVRRNFDVR